MVRRLMQQLTRMQVRMLEFIELWTERRGRSPSVRQISRGLGLKSSSSVLYHLRAMERRGVIVRVRKRGRGIQVVRRPVQPTDPIQELNDELAQQLAAALRRLVNALLPVQSREHLTRAELHYIRQAVACGIAVVQKLDVLDATRAPSRDNARREADDGDLP